MRPSPVLAALALAACASPKTLPPEIDPGTPAVPPAGDERIVALVDGEAVTWRQVAERAMELNGPQLAENFVRWKLLRDSARKLGIENTPEDLRARAQLTLDLARRAQGEESVKKYLREAGQTEEQYVGDLAANPRFGERLLAEKIVAYLQLTEPSVEVDAVIFTEEGDASAFVARLKEGGTFEKVSEQTLAGSSAGRIVHLPRRRLARGFFPSALLYLEDRLLAMKEGETTGLERTPDNLPVVARVASVRPASEGPYERLRAQVMQEVLGSPPGDEQINIWMGQLLKGSKIHYEDRNTARDKVR